MKSRIAIFGSTGSIGKTTLDIIRKDKKNFEVVLLTSNNKINELLIQAKEFNVKNLIINNKNCYEKFKLKNKNINFYNNFTDINKIFKKKIDYIICAISGIPGLDSTLRSIKHTNRVAIANKESIICAWNLIEKELIKNKTQFIPVDSEHFSIWSLLNNKKNKSIEEIIITASGGPFLNLKLSKFKTITPKKALKHPTWKMGKKISIDSATMMNKVFEVIEAQRIFNIDFKKFKIFTHPKSYVHAIVKFNNGLSKILAHDTSMSIPIFNSIYHDTNKNIQSKKLNFSILNDLNFQIVNIKKFPVLNILNKIPNKNSLLETVLVSANDELVSLFLEKKIKFIDISTNLLKILSLSEFKSLRSRKPKNYQQILNLSNYVRLKIRIICNKKSYV